MHDFGQNLIEEIHSSSTIGRSDDVPLVLIGHSMGGLAIKKAVILSRENPAYKTIGDRIHSLYFLVTPHRGSDPAKALNNILKMVFKDTKAYITNLERSSEAQQVISDSFRHYYSGIHIHSFLESIPMNLGYGFAPIVDRSSATLGYTEERVQFLNAYHRSIGKYESPLDPNFKRSGIGSQPPFMTLPEMPHKACNRFIANTCVNSPHISTSQTLPSMT